MPKPYKKLTRADLSGAPIWEWVPEDVSANLTDAHDDSWVQATALTAVPTGSFAQYVVAATIGLKHGGQMPGIAEVTVAEGKAAVVPTELFLLDRHLRIPGVETNRLLARYTKTIGNHPVSWELGVLVGAESRPRAGRIKGGDMKNVVAAGVQVLLALKALRKP